MSSKKTKNPGVIQPTMFDIVATPHVPVERKKLVKNENPTLTEKDIREVQYFDTDVLGLNAVYEGRSKVYKDFSDYIKKSNILK